MPELPDYSQMSMDNFFSRLDLDKIVSVVLASEPNLEIIPVVEEAELEVVKTMVATVKQQSVNQISNIPKITEAVDLLINSSILEDQKVVLAKNLD